MLRTRPQPSPKVRWIENHRHPVVDRPHEVIGVSDDDGARVEDLAALGIFPVLPEPCERHGLCILAADEVRLLAALGRLPLFH
jgi:hypothetical protein